MKIGIMGGTFDPIHNGHIHIALAAYKEYGLDRVWFMPAGDPYFKQGQGVSSPADRLEMTQLAIESYLDKFQCSDMEMIAKGHTYSAETFSLLHKLFPEDEFYFIIGYDSLRSLSKWYHPEKLLKFAIILCALRDNGTMDEAEQIAAKLKEDFGAAHPDIRFIHTPLIDISSTMIREAVRAGEDISRYVPQAVAEYIEEQHMYVNDTCVNAAQTAADSCCAGSQTASDSCCAVNQTAAD